MFFVFFLWVFAFFLSLRQALGDLAAPDTPTLTRYVVSGARQGEHSADVEYSLKLAGWDVHSCATFMSQGSRTCIVASANPPPFVQVLRPGRPSLWVRIAGKDDARPTRARTFVAEKGQAKGKPVRLPARLDTDDLLDFPHLPEKGTPKSTPKPTPESTPKPAPQDQPVDDMDASDDVSDDDAESGPPPTKKSRGMFDAMKGLMHRLTPKKGTDDIDAEMAAEHQHRFNTKQTRHQEEWTCDICDELIETGRVRRQCLEARCKVHACIVCCKEQQQ